MAGNASAPHSLYDVWAETASNSKTYWKARVPSKEGQATIELLDWDTLDAPTQAILLDRDQMPAWKLYYFELAYQQFRKHEVARKHASKGEFDENVTIEIGTLPASYQWVSISAIEDHTESDEVVDRLLSYVSPIVAERICKKVLDGRTFVEIAREENPHASETEIATAANSIGRSVKRGLQQLRKILESECPLSNEAKDV